MKILVIEDQAYNIEAAKKTLQGHELTIIEKASDVKRFFSIENDSAGKKFLSFDLVMTDLFMPVDEKFSGCARKEIGKELPVGLVVALKAVRCGVPVVIFSDLNHHENEVTTLMDILYSTCSLEWNSKGLAIMDAEMCGTGLFLNSETNEFVGYDAMSKALGHPTYDYKKGLAPFNRVKDWGKCLKEIGFVK